MTGIDSCDYMILEVICVRIVGNIDILSFGTKWPLRGQHQKSTKNSFIFDSDHFIVRMYCNKDTINPVAKTYDDMYQFLSSFYNFDF